MIQYFFFTFFPFFYFATQLFSTAVTSSNLRHQAPPFTGNRYKGFYGFHSCALRHEVSPRLLFSKISSPPLVNDIVAIGNHTINATPLERL